MRTTFGQFRASRIPLILNLNSADSTRLAQYANEAQLRLLQKGKWWGTVQRIQVCVNNGCLTWPRQVANAEAVIVGCTPVESYDNWFEYLPDGRGPLGEDCCDNSTDGESCNRGTNNCGLLAVDRGTSPVFSDIIGTSKKVRVYIDNPDDASKTILLQGYDENGNILLTDSGETRGERVLLTFPYVDTVNFFAGGLASGMHMPMGITGVQKDVTLGAVRLYELNTLTATQRLIAVYDPDETVPSYRRSFINGLCNLIDSETCSTSLVTAECKLDYIPVKVDSDYLLIGNLGALKSMCQAIRKEEDNLWDDAQKYEAKAVQILEEELMHYRGSGLKPVIRAESRGTFWGGGIETATSGGYVWW